MHNNEKIGINHLEGEHISHFKSLSGIDYKRIYDERDWSGRLPDAGEYPFIRGVHRDMYRGRLWTRRQQSGFGSPQESNQLIKYLLGIGQTGINMDADIATKLGLDPDYPLAQGDVGLQGTSLCTYEDMKALFKDIPLNKVSTTLIIQPPCSAIIMAQYLLMAKEQSIPWENLLGTIMNCAFTQLVGPTYQANTAFFPIDLQVKIALDLMQFLIPRAPRWNIINVNSRNIRETGVNAVQEVAFVFSLACDYIQGLLERGLDIDAFAPRMAFFSAVHMDLFEEVAKFRAMRRIWARIMKERFGAENAKSMWCRIAVQTSALPLSAQEPMNNIVRSSIQTLAAVLAGTQSIHTTAYDEAYGLPTKEAQKLAIRTQQIIAYETGVMKSVDPLGGSYLVETLTNEIEERIWELMKVIERKGGFIRCFKNGWVEEQLNEARYRMADDIEMGEQSIVGVNVFRQEGQDTKIEIFRQSPDMQAKRIQYVRQYKMNRNQQPVRKALERLSRTVRDGLKTNLMEPVIDAVMERATLQEICDAMRDACDFKIPE